MERRRVYQAGTFQGAVTTLMRVLFNANQEAARCATQGEPFTVPIGQARGALAALQALHAARVTVPPECADVYRQVVALLQTGAERLEAFAASDGEGYAQLNASYQEDLNVVMVALAQLRARFEGE